MTYSVGSGSGDDFTAKLVKAIQALIDANSISTTYSADGDSSNEATISGLDAGYYYVTTTVGTVVSTGTTPTTGTTTTIQDKNNDPTVTKYVYDGEETDTAPSVTSTTGWDTDAEESVTGNSDAEIGETVWYKSVVTNVYGQSSLKLIDTLSTGLTLNINTGDIVVTLYYGTGATTPQVLTADDDYTITTTAQSFTIDFAKLLDSSTNSSKVDSTCYIVVTYSAVLNENATVYNSTDKGSNTNTTYVAYGQSSESARDITKTYTYAANIFKYQGTVDENNALSNASFIILDSDKTHYAKFTLESGVYVFAGWENYTNDASATENGSGYYYTLTTDGTGLLQLAGLDGETSYYIHETAAPTGYNLMTSDLLFFIAGSEPATIGQTQGTVYGSTTETTSSITDSVTISGTTYTAITIKNETGTGLPATGGIGVTIFYVVGGILILAAAGVIVINRKKIKK
ncbi:MAG: LPXTG cell wall anchor domain-containing protein [Oscillospiraceae bacterium]|nr:LPXTG cell wall anchor domain-containing protein [Oscillospiraceae bacterium]